MKNPKLRWSAMSFGLLAVCFVVGCSAQKTTDASGKHTPSDQPSAASLAILSKADAKDGNVDKVIAKCVTCRLAMDGKPEYSVTYGGYAVHLCSEECRKTFSGDPEKALGDLSLSGEGK